MATPYPVLVVVVNYKTAQLTLACLKTLAPELRELPGSRVVVVENRSGDEAALAEGIAANGWGGWVELDVADRNGGFAYGNNRAIRPTLTAADPPRYVLLLNSDTEVRAGAVRTLVRFMDEHPTAGIAGSGFENLDGSVWPFAFRFITPLSELDRGLRLGLVTRLLRRHVPPRVMDQTRPQRADWVAGACMMIRHSLFHKIGLMDEGYFLYFEEVDFCLRAARRGAACWYVPESRVMHIAGQSSELTKRDVRPPRTPAYWYASRRRYFLKHYGFPGALLADLAFGVGYAVWQVRRVLTRGPAFDPPHTFADHWKHSVLFQSDRRVDRTHPS
jgi:GT2 family glycosyltransferase